MYAFYAGNQHIGFALTESGAQQVHAALYWYGGIGTVSFKKSTQATPKKWADQWLPVFFPKAGTEWGRFKKPFNRTVTEAINRYFATWSSQQKPWMAAAATRDMSDSQVVANAKRVAQQDKESERRVCEMGGKRPVYDSSGTWIGCN